MMQGKIKFKLSKDFFFGKRNYQIFVDDKLIGVLCNRNNKLDFSTNYGNHLITIKGKNYSESLKVELGSANVIQPLYVSHKMPYRTKLPPVWNKILKGISIAFLFIMLYNFFSKDYDFPYYIYIPIVFSAFSSNNNNDREFKISSKKICFS